MDELYPELVIPGTEYSLTAQGGKKSRTFVTDQDGYMELSDLEKNTTYHLKEKKVSGDYNLDETDYTFTVDEDGRIDGQVQPRKQISNRMIRVQVNVKDILYQNNVSDYGVAIYDENNTLKERWDSSGTARKLQGLKPGKYYLLVEGNANKRMEITVEDVCEEQEYSYSTWTNMSFLTVACAAVVVLVLLLVVIILKKRKAGKKHE